MARRHQLDKASADIDVGLAHHPVVRLEELFVHELGQF